MKSFYKASCKAYEVIFAVPNRVPTNPYKRYFYRGPAALLGLVTQGHQITRTLTNTEASYEMESFVINSQWLSS